MATKGKKLCAGDDNERRSLPHDLVAEHILARLPVKSLLRFKSVSKEWYSSISSRQFAQSHLNFSSSRYLSSSTGCMLLKSRNCRYYLYNNVDEIDCDDDNRVLVDGDDNNVKSLVRVRDSVLDTRPGCHYVGSCDGLVCFRFEPCGFYLWNPATHLGWEIPDPYPVEGLIRVGFGSVSSDLNDYKIVVIKWGISTSKGNVAYVFSLKTSSWSRIESSLLHRRDLMLSEQAGVLVDKTLHWPISFRGPNGSTCFGILGFDLVCNMLIEIRVPQSNDLAKIEMVCSIGGCLSCFITHDWKNAQLWVLKQYADWDSWTKEFTISRNLLLCAEYYPNLVSFTKTGELIRQFKRCGPWILDPLDPNQIPVKYSPQTQCMYVVVVMGYVPSLISPFGITEVRKEWIKELEGFQE